jgi:hypothetical protein
MHSGYTSADSVPPLLRLPVELRRQVYSLLLPYTLALPLQYHRSPDPTPRAEYNLTFVRLPSSAAGSWKMQKTSPKSERSSGNDIVWRRGCTALLAVCKQVHEEAADMLYGSNTFVLDVTFQKIAFRYRWRTENGLTPSRAIDWLEHFSQRNLLRVKRYVVNVESVDDYTGMIKYNVGGRGLPAGIRARVRALVDLLVLVRHLQKLDVHLIDGDISRHRFPGGRVHRVQDESHYAQTQTVLDPFRALYGVRQVQVTGVSEEYARTLEVSMAAQRGTAHA